MKRASRLFIILSAISQFVYAQAPLTSDSLIMLHPNALQFQIADKSILQSFQGTTISFKHHYDRLSAYRLGVSLSFNNLHNDNSSSSFLRDTLSYGGSATMHETSVSMWLQAQRLWYVDNPTSVFFFLGTGPYVGVSRSSSHSETLLLPVESDFGKQTIEQITTGISLGMSALAGVEWFATKAISLHAEYDVNVGFSWNKNHQTSDASTPGYYTTTEATVTQWQLASLGVKFGLSVYF